MSLVGKDFMSYEMDFFMVLLESQVTLKTGDVAPDFVTSFWICAKPSNVENGIRISNNNNKKFNFKYFTIYNII